MAGEHRCGTGCLGYVPLWADLGGAYSVNERDTVYDIPKPATDGFITGMEAHLVDANGARVPVRRVMLHHVVFSNAGSRLGERVNPTCRRITMFDGVSQLPGMSEPFFGSAEEESRVRGCGFDVFRQKPIEPADLAHEIARLAAQHAAR